MILDLYFRRPDLKRICTEKGSVDGAPCHGGSVCPPVSFGSPVLFSPFRIKEVVSHSPVERPFGLFRVVLSSVDGRPPMFVVLGSVGRLSSTRERDLGEKGPGLGRPQCLSSIFHPSFS